MRRLANTNLEFKFSRACLSEEDWDIVQNFPPLFDPDGGARRWAQKEKERRREESEAQAGVTIEAEENPEAGSLQLGGEPEERQIVGGLGQGQQHAIQPPSLQNTNGASGLGQNLPLPDDILQAGMGARGLTPQQMLLQQFKSPTNQSPTMMNAFNNQNQAQQPNAFGQPGAPPGHARHQSRFTFANDSASASANVKPVANSKLMNQQSSMMPQGNSFNHLGHQPLGHQFQASTVQGPPPGLKTTGTPPVSGGGMFGQGHGFATAGLGYGANVAGRNGNEDMMRELMRGQRGGVPDAGKREYLQNYLNQQSQHYPTPSSTTPAPQAPGLFNHYAPQPGAGYQHSDSGSSSMKQKKKGKKHRHANTTSSGGGGGGVDVSDQNILQARLQHGGGIGQGLYGAGLGGQGQGAFGGQGMYGGGFGGGRPGPPGW